MPLTGSDEQNTIVSQLIHIYKHDCTIVIMNSCSESCLEMERLILPSMLQEQLLANGVS